MGTWTAAPPPVQRSLPRPLQRRPISAQGGAGFLGRGDPVGGLSAFETTAAILLLKALPPFSKVSVPPVPEPCGGFLVGCVIAAHCWHPGHLFQLALTTGLFCHFSLGGNGSAQILAYTLLLGLSFQGSDLSSVMSVGRALPRSTRCRSTPGCTQASGRTPAPCAARRSPPSTRCWST